MQVTSGFYNKFFDSMRGNTTVASITEKAIKAIEAKDSRLKYLDSYLDNRKKESMIVENRILRNNLSYQLVNARSSDDVLG